jgi:small subunit ribosomal protein S9
MTMEEQPTEAPVPAQPEQAVEVAAPAPVRPATGRRVGDTAFGVGRRKTAVARVTMKPGSGKMTVNGREPMEYFRRLKSLDEVNRPFVATGTAGKFDISVAVSGAGPASQAGALRLAISRALAAWQEDLRPALSAEGLLTRDPRMVERKKYGIRGARRRPQWTKR